MRTHSLKTVRCTSLHANGAVHFIGNGAHTAMRDDYQVGSHAACSGKTLRFTDAPAGAAATHTHAPRTSTHTRHAPQRLQNHFRLPLPPFYGRTLPSVKKKLGRCGPPAVSALLNCTENSLWPVWPPSCICSFELRRKVLVCAVEDCCLSGLSLGGTE